MTTKSVTSDNGTSPSIAALPVTVLSILGTTLDRASPKKRWERWRPTVALCSQEDLVVHRLELLHSPQQSVLAEQIAEDVRAVSPETTVQLVPLHFEDPWDFEEVYGGLHDFAEAYTFKPERERYLIHMTTGSHVVQICWFLLAESRRVPAQLVQTAPPRRRDGDSAGTHSIIDLDLSRYDRIAQRFVRQTHDNLSFLKSGIQTRNAAFNRLITQIERVAINSSAPMLFTGPTGAGKSQLAGRIYELKHSKRQVEGPFVEVNCATLRGDSAMSALFGHKKGAFTGAMTDRPGLLRAADKGILFLDEIAELGLDEQAMLLRAIEEKRFLPVGSDKEVVSDFSLFAGTNRDLRERVAQGAFREDLWARINLWTFELPGLAARPEDIEPNLEYELDRFAEQTGRRISFNKEARQAFLRFAKSPQATWSGNFRDFNACITRMGTLAPGGRIDRNTVKEELARLTHQWRIPGQSFGAPPQNSTLQPGLLSTLDRFDRVQLEDVARVCQASPSLSEAGRRLYAESRKLKKNPNDADRLRKYLARFELSFSDFDQETP